MKIKNVIMTIVLLCIMMSIIATAYPFRVGSFGFSISSSDYRSAVGRWTATNGTASSERIYINTMASVKNSGAEDTYYLVALTASGAGCNRVLANGSQVRRNMYSYSFTYGTTYGGFAWRYDSTLNTYIVDGYVFIWEEAKT